MSLRPLTRSINNLTDEDLEDFSAHLKEVITESIPENFKSLSKDQLVSRIFMSISRKLELEDRS